MNRSLHSPRLPLVLAAALCLALSAPAAAQAKKGGRPAPKPPAPLPLPHSHAHEDELPKPAPRGNPETPKMLPPFLGLFGSESLLEKTGFRSKVGSWIEFETRSAASGGAVGGTVRFQHVAPQVRGSRWIEMIASTPGADFGAVRMLTRGTGKGNLERLIVLTAGMPPLEMPLDSAELDVPAAQGGSGQIDFGEVTSLGKKTITVPLGKFETEHYRFTVGAETLEYWITRDEKVPFTGAVRIAQGGNTLEATQVGTDAVARVPLPQNNESP